MRRLLEDGEARELGSCAPRTLPRCGSSIHNASRHRLTRRLRAVAPSVACDAGLIAHSGNLYGGLEKALETFARGRAPAASSTSNFALCFDGPVALALREIGVSPTIVGGLRLTRPHQLGRRAKRFAEAVARLTPDVVTTSPWSHVVFARWCAAPACRCSCGCTTSSRGARSRISLWASPARHADCRQPFLRW